MIDIFIRTYSKDLPFLAYCLKSISKYVTGYRDIIICIPENEKHLLAGWNLTKEKVIGWNPTTKNGYIDQQINKLLSYHLTDAEYILFVDSDVCFNRPVDVREEYFVNGKPYLMKTRYELVGDAICWKQPTEEILNINLDFEYMRRIPLMFKSDTLRLLDEQVDCLSLASRERLSEFNIIGAYAAINQESEYYIIDTETDTFPSECAKQGWSWGGLTPEIKEQLNEWTK
jgi:hypothetical protein